MGVGGGELLRQQTDACNSCVSPVRQHRHWNHLPEHEWTKYHRRYTQKCTQHYYNIINVALECGALYHSCYKSHVIFLLQPI